MAVGSAVIVAAGVVAIRSTELSSLEVTGIADGQELSRGELEDVRIVIDRDGLAAGDVRVELNGTELPTVEEDGELVARLSTVNEGENALVVSMDGKLFLGGEQVERRFVVTPAGPDIYAPDEVVVALPGQVMELRAMAPGAVSVTANGTAVTLEPGGAFTTDVAPNAGSVRLEAVDAAGNSNVVTVQVTDDPAAPAYPPTTAVRISAAAWSDPAFRQPIIDLARAGKINAVELDIKDENGEVGYASAVPLATTIGSARSYYDAAAAVDELHALGVRVIGRIVCFLDPLLAGWAWSNQRPELTVLNATGSAPLASNYGSAAFTNLANAEVRQYQIDLAREAVGHGFDEILYDYVRRPEGDLSTMAFVGLDAGMTPEVAVAKFVAETEEQIDEVDPDAMLGISVFGISATRPEQIAQDIRLMAPHVDYVSPMVYPSHWGPGEYGVPDPVRQPAEIVERSVLDFQRVVAGSGAAVVPWLQDFTYGGVAYGPAEVTAQIDAAMGSGARGFLLWNPGSTYHVEVLDRPTS
ncbi:MAG TPA: putative glycoside hydrolase [Acidimicrobiales bacterium]|nr:putative glycoside hydrolase [Acidimicrobiales bacterium]